MEEEVIKTEGIGMKRKEDGTFDVGTAPGPGRPKDTPETIVIKKAIKELVKEYKDDLAQMLPKIKPVIEKKALEGDMCAIKEIHDRVMDKSKQPTDITSGGDKIVIPIYGGTSVPEHNINQKDIQPNQEN